MKTSDWLHRKTLLFAVMAITIVGSDIATKRWALARLNPGETVPGLSGFIPFTLAFNKGAAFSLHLGAASRWAFLILSIVALAALISLYWNTRRDDWARLSSIALVSAGAIGNLIDRARWDRGVVDFIGPIDLGILHWPIFNIADMAITCGAVVLATSLWREGAAPARIAQPHS
jgi:signal peptidase II